MRDGFLYQHVPTPAGGGQRQRQMEVMWGDNIHRIHVGMTQQFLRTPERMGNPVLAGEGLGAVPVHVRDGAYLHVGEQPDGLRVGVGHGPGAQQTEAKRHHTSP